MTCNPCKEACYSIHVFEDHAIIQGCVSGDALIMLIRLCEKEGFTYLVPFECGFKLVKRSDE